MDDKNEINMTSSVHLLWNYIVVENELFWQSFTKLHCIHGELQRVYAICPLAPTLYKYSELQMFDATQKLSCKAGCKTPFFLIVFVHSIIFKLMGWYGGGGGGGGVLNEIRFD